MARKNDFHERLSRFIVYLGLKPTSFEAEMGFSNGSIGKLLNDKRALTSDRLEKIFYKYPELDPEWLMTGKGEMIKKNSILVSEPVTPYRENIVVDRENNVLIPIADIKAAAGHGYMNTEVLRTSDFVQLPDNLLKSGKYLCIRIKGNSMSPTLQDAGFVIIRLLEKAEWSSIYTDRVYVVCDNEGQAYLKRVRNRIDNGGFLVLTSDNPDKATYPNFNLRLDEITSIWYVEWYLSAKMPNIHDQFYGKLQRLEDSIDDINQRLKRILP